MKKTSKTIQSVKELRAEYRFDYGKGKPNRFADKVADDTVVVVLDADVAKVFTTSESVNTALRALIAAVPDKLRTKVTHK